MAKLKSVHMLSHPSKPRQYVFAVMTHPLVRVTRYDEKGRRQEDLPVSAARGRYGFLRDKMKYVPGDNGWRFPEGC